MADPDTWQLIATGTHVYAADGDMVPMCIDAASEIAVLCYDDGEYHENVIYCNSDRNWYSEEYAQDHMLVCEDCGGWYWYDDITEIDGEYYCSNCIDDHTIIDRYHGSTFEPVGEDPEDRFIGFELETDGRYYHPHACALELHKTFGSALTFEEDCSLSNGVEIISQPHSIDALANLDIVTIVGTCLDYGADINPASAGLHLHFSRTWFGATEEIQTATIARVIKAYALNWDWFVEESNRNERAIDNRYGYARKPVYDPDYDRYLPDEDIVSQNNDTRYRAVNLDNYYTVEFRLGAGYLVPEFIRDWIDLHIDLITKCRRDAERDLLGDAA